MTGVTLTVSALIVGAEIVGSVLAYIVVPLIAGYALGRRRRRR